MEDTPTSPGADEANFADNVLLLREHMGWSQTDLSRRMIDAGFSNFNQMTVSRTENGDRPIRLSEARGLAHVFGRRVDDMILSPGESRVRDQLLRIVGEVSEAGGTITSWTVTMLACQMDLGKAMQDVAIKEATTEPAGAAPTKLSQRLWAETTELLKEAHAIMMRTPEDAVADGRRQFEEMFSGPTGDSRAAGSFASSRGSAERTGGELK